MKPSKNEKMKMAMSRGIITKENYAPFIERAAAYKERFGEAPRIDISVGSAPAHDQVSALFFEKEYKLKITLAENDVSVRNQKTGRIVNLEFDRNKSALEVVNSQGALTMVKVEQLTVKGDEITSLGDVLSRVRLVEVDSLNEIIHHLKESDPEALWVECKNFNEGFIANRVFGTGEVKSDMLNEVNLITRKDINNMFEFDNFNI